MVVCVNADAHADTSQEGALQVIADPHATPILATRCCTGPTHS